MAEASLTVSLRDLPPVRQAVWDLRQLQDEMRVAADPYAERLERILDRMFAYGEDDHASAPD